MMAVSRATAPGGASSTRLLAVLGAVLLLSACGEPPQPLPTGPPDRFGTVAPSSAPGYPAAGLPPTYALPTYPAATPPVTLPPTTPATTGPPPAPRCAHGPTPAQVLAVVRTQPGIPSGVALDVKAGPYCAGGWQFTVVGESGKTLDQVDPLQVVTTGQPDALRVVEAGQDVCSDRVQSSAPPGIRVLACG
jgi:hypothetical protein